MTHLAAAKTELLDVPISVIETHSAMSCPVARAMAEGVLANTAADLALAIAGLPALSPMSAEIRSAATLLQRPPRRASALNTVANLARFRRPSCSMPPFERPSI
ncbi:CinA family protein [Bosea lathyri]|uniref:CinA family protein n=1 Tax=Bosea lathyri TaxID=1036778 RepID=UPI000CDED7AA